MPSDLYRLLQQHLDRMPVPFPATESGVELRILRRLFNEEEAKTALALSMVPELPATIRKRLARSITLDALVALLESMVGKGLIERVTIRKRKRYAKSILAVGIYERQQTRLTAELQRDVEEYFDEAFGGAFHSVRPQQMRTVPVKIDLTPQRNVASYDDIRGFVTQTGGPFAVMDCICRHGRDLMGDPCRQTAMRNTCLTFGAAARGMVASGAARFVPREETLEILTLADREGLVLQPQNTTKPLFVCCCCGCCCGVLRSAKRMPEPASVFTTNYVAEADDEICSGCAECESRCQMDAVSMFEGSSVIDASRCIGCGLCVTTCATGAMRLSAKPTSSEPPRSTPALYLKMYRERFGTFEMALALGKAFVGRRV